MKRAALYLTLIISSLWTTAFHIVGGEIEFIYVRDGVYRINLIQYFDEAQTQNPGPDPFLTIFIFRNGDNELMSQHVLTLIGQEPVEYTNIECAIDELQTSRVLYSAEIQLDPNLYTNPSGYYIQWERCCRNSAVDNLVNPDGTGMNYVLEIPPLMKDGEIFINSSPVLFKPLSDYACVNQLYYVEFTGIDPDGDSLVYSLATPLNSSSQVALPIPQPKPHFNVTFGPGFSEEEMIPGSRPLKISNKGLLTVNPSQTGLFVFAIKVEEYRDGEKIGEVRRDFQMLVVDGCEPPDPPVVDIEIPDDPTFNPDTDVLTYTVTDAKCFNFFVANITEGERISLRAEGVNFDEDLNEIFSFRDSLVTGTTDELFVEICVPDCPPISDGPFILDLIAADDACPLPQLDTMRLTIIVQPPPNELPTYSVSSSTINVQEDSFYSQDISGSDTDGDDLSASLLVEGIEDPSMFGFDLTVNNSASGSIEATFSWDTDCEEYDFTDIQDFDVAIIFDDSDECEVPADTLFIDAHVILPPNTDPFITLDGTLPAEMDLGTRLDLDVTATDADGDDVTLRFVGGNFNPEVYGVNFDVTTGSGSVTNNFEWELACDASRFFDGQEFEMIFVADDNDKCKIKNFDTVRHILKVNYPANANPSFEPTDRFQSIRVNELVEIPLEAFDTDGDEITIDFAEGFRQPASNTLSLAPATAFGRVSSVLAWQPECSLLRFGETSTLLDVVVQVTDNACPVERIDTLKMTFEIFDDRERQKSFLPPNVITPNGDTKNDTFRLSGNFDVNQNLPPDNCDNAFEYIVINNRAGTQVFRSSNRDFVWSGGQFPSGVYYYVIKFTNTEFKGYIHLMR